MRYVEYKETIQKHLKRNRQGATWQELRSKLALPYGRPCPEWMKRLDTEIGMVRSISSGRSFIWKII